MMEKTVKIDKIYLFLLVLSIAISLFFELSLCPFPHQHELFFRSGEDFFADFFKVSVSISEENIYNYDKNMSCVKGYLTQVDRAYPPLAYIPFLMLRRAVPDASSSNPLMQIAALLFVSFATASFSCILCHYLKFNFGIKFWFGSCLLLSGIYMFSLERGNLILLSAILTSFFLFNYKSKNPYLKELALIALALAAGIKISPALLGCLLLCEKDWKGAARLCIYGIIAFFLPFYFLPGKWNNIPLLLENMKLFSEYYFLLDSKVFCEGYVSLFAKTGLEQKTAATGVYIVSIILGIVSLGLGWIEKIQWRRLFLFVFAMLLLPQVAHRYSYLYLFPCMIIFFNEAENSRMNFCLAVLFALFLAPFQIIIIRLNITKFWISMIGDLFFLVISISSMSQYIKQKFIQNRIRKV